MEGRELRRSYTQVDFPVGRNKNDLTKQVRTNKRFAMPTNRMKFPTLEIYRPPDHFLKEEYWQPPQMHGKKAQGQRMMQDVRDGGPGLDDSASKLNVHAKEFVMNHSGALQTSKSTGNILAHHGEGKRVQIGGRALLGHTKQPLQTRNDINQVKVQKEEAMKSIMRDSGRPREGNELRRSKSLYVSFTSSNNNNNNNNNQTNSSSSSSASSGGMTAALAAALVEQQNLPKDVAHLVAKAHGDISDYTLGDFAQLARSLVQKTEEDRRYAEKLADACIGVIEREPHSTFLEALVNYLIFSVDRKSEEPARTSSHSLLAFLSHLYTQIKAMGRFVDGKLRSGPHPSTQILHLLAQSCISTLRNPNLNQRSEVECLFFVVTTIGRELEQDSLRLSEELMDSVRDALYFSTTSDRIRRTLLQLLELHAAKWQIPAESLSFYQSTSDK